MELQFTFQTIAIAIVKLFILMLAGYALHRVKFTSDEFVDKLSLLLVYLIFPALIVSKTIDHFSFTEYAYWWFLPLCAILFSFVGMLMGRLLFGFLKNFSSKKEFVCACGFQNCGYLPMNLILFAFSGALADRLLVYMFMFILGFNILMWSLAPLFLTGRLKEGFKLRVLLNPPVVATVFSLVWVALFGRGTLPAIVMDPLKQLGQAAFPLAMLTLGAYLHRYRAYSHENKMPLIAGAGIKLFIFPAIVLFLLKWIPLGFDYKFFLFLQAIMPTAVSLVVIGSYTGADNKFFSGIIFYTHLVGIFSIPVWLAVFNFLRGA
ncbi:MAG: AEC family transporter [Candidatus Omnitrophota bacterium]|jgi:predicted permease